jgi:glutathione S-transferase
MRYWNKFVDEHVMNYVSMHGWHRFVGALARGIEKGEFERLMERIPLHEQREKWRTARSGFNEADLANAKRKILVALEKVEDQLSRAPWLAGSGYTLADINFFSHCGMYVNRMFPDLTDERKHPRLSEWRERIAQRPAVKAALAMPDRTNPALRTFTGEVH